MSKQQEVEQAFSPRSAASLRREADLRGQLARLETKIARAKKKLAEQEQRRDGAMRSMRTGKGWQTQQNLNEALIEIQGLTLSLEAMGKEKAGMEAELAAECATPDNRAELQAQLAGLARKRLESDDAAIEKLLEGLRTALARRGDRTQDMKQLAAQIEFEGDFDESRFATLAAALSPILPASARWAGQFLGAGGKGLVRAVARVAFELPETLHNSGQAKPGDELLLTEEQFAALSVSSYGLKVGDSCFKGEERKHFTERKVVSAEQAEQDRAAAQRRGIELESFWEEQDEAEFQTAKKARELLCERANYDRGVENLRSQNGISEAEARHRYERQYGARP